MNNHLRGSQNIYKSEVSKTSAKVQTMDKREGKRSATYHEKIKETVLKSKKAMKYLQALGNLYYLPDIVLEKSNARTKGRDA